MELAIFACVLFFGFGSYSLWYGKRSRDKFYAADIQRLTRYIEACQWVSSMRVSPYDIDCYSLYRLSDSMKKWADETGKNPLEITQFRDYCNWLIGYTKALSAKDGWLLVESLVDGPIVSSVRSSSCGGSL